MKQTQNKTNRAIQNYIKICQRCFKLLYRKKMKLNFKVICIKENFSNYITI